MSGFAETSTLAQKFTQAVSHQSLDDVRGLLDKHNVFGGFLCKAIDQAIDQEWFEGVCVIMDHIINTQNFSALHGLHAPMRRCPSEVWEHTLKSLSLVFQHDPKFGQVFYLSLFDALPQKKASYLKMWLLSEPALVFNRAGLQSIDLMIFVPHPHPDLQKKMIETLSGQEAWTVLQLLEKMKDFFQDPGEKHLQTFMSLLEAKPHAWWLEVAQCSTHEDFKPALGRFHDFRAHMEKKCLEHDVGVSHPTRLHPVRKI